jgi:dihydrofolate reductase
MIVSLIVAVDRAGGIGKAGRLPWHLRSDMQRFKQLTMGHHILMGRKTYQSIGKPLAGRNTIIVTRNPAYQAEGCMVVQSMQAGLLLAEGSGENEIFVIGGGEIYAQALPYASRLYLTRVETDASCDTFFPEVAWEDWQEIDCSRHAEDEQNQHAFSMYVYERQGEAARFR